MEDSIFHSAHLEDMSACASKLLFERMKECPSIPRKIVLPATLVERGSVIEIQSNP